MAKDRVDATSLFSSMQKRSEFPKNQISEPVKEMEEEKIIKDTQSLESELPKKKENSRTSNDSTLVINEKIDFTRTEKERKTVHKNFLIKASLASKLSDKAIESGFSENELLNLILEKVL